jgi:YggT family protein
VHSAVIPGPDTLARRPHSRFPLGAMMQNLLIGVDIGLEIYCWILVAFATLHLLSGFKVIDIQARPAAEIDRWLDKVTMFPLWPVRRILPDLGEIDISPIVLILIVMVVRYAFALYALPKLL